MNSNYEFITSVRDGETWREQTQFSKSYSHSYVANLKLPNHWASSTVIQCKYNENEPWRFQIKITHSNNCQNATIHATFDQLACCACMPGCNNLCIWCPGMVKLDRNTPQNSPRIFLHESLTEVNNMNKQVHLFMRCQADRRANWYGAISYA